MADRNPFIPAERAQDVESKETFIEDEANEKFAEKEAELNEESADYPQGESDSKAQRTDQYAAHPGGKPQMRSMTETASKKA